VQDEMINTQLALIWGLASLEILQLRHGDLLVDPIDEFEVVDPPHVEVW
jgi:hypothetical protein